MKTKILAAAAIILTGCFFSCSKKSITVNSITGTFDEIDRDISLGQTQDAVKLLKQLDKPSLAPAIRLGIYRRYVKLGEKEKADGTVAVRFRDGRPQQVMKVEEFIKYLKEKTETHFVGI